MREINYVGKSFRDQRRERLVVWTSVAKRNFLGSDVKKFQAVLELKGQRASGYFFNLNINMSKFKESQEASSASSGGFFTLLTASFQKCETSQKCVYSVTSDEGGQKNSPVEELLTV